MKNKKVLIILLTVVLVIGIILGIYFLTQNKKETTPENNTITNTPKEAQITQVENYIGKLNDGTLINTNAKMNAPSTLGDLALSNIRLTLKNGITTFKATVVNNGSSATSLKNLELKLFNENNEEMVKATGLLDSLQPGESKDLTISITSDYIHACGYSLVEK